MNLPRNMRNNQSSFQWWMSLVKCPWCGKNLCGDDSFPNKECESCGKYFELKNNKLEWTPADGKTKRHDTPKGIVDVLKRALNPLSNPLLPMRYWTKFRIEQYYRRILNDRSLAEKWVGHYFSGLDLPPDAIILEHGCARGRNLALLNHLDFKVAGQDMVDNEWWENLSGNGFQVVPPDCRFLPWKDSSFDVVINIQVISYLPKLTVESLVQEVKRVLKPGGYWVIQEANNASYGQKSFLYEQLLPVKLMRSLVAANGFDEVDVSYEGFYAKYFPLFINFIRKQCFSWSMDMYDFDSWIAEQIPPEKRGFWLLRLKLSE